MNETHQTYKKKKTKQEFIIKVRKKSSVMFEDSQCIDSFKKTGKIK